MLTDKSIRWAGTALLLFQTSGCSAPDENASSAPVRGDTVLRVDLAGNDQALTIRGIAHVAKSGRTTTAAVPSLGGKLMVVTRIGGRVHQAMPFRMPSEAFVEGRGKDGMRGQRVGLENADLTLMLDDTEPLDALEIQNEAGVVLASATRDELTTKGASLSGAGPRPLAAEAPSAALQALLEAYPQIYFLDPSVGDDLPGVYAFSEVEGLRSIDDTAAVALREALDRVPAPALGAVRSVALGTFEQDSNTIGISYGSSMIINSLIETEPLQVVETVVHEATHNYQFLVDGDLSTALLNPEAWPVDVQHAAAATTAKFNLTAGLTLAWQELHGTGVDLGFATEFSGDDWQELGKDAAAAGGFASQYGSSDAAEDMAEYVARLRVPENGGESEVCALVRSAPAPFPPENAIPFAKVKFLESLGLLDAGEVGACVGSPDLTGPPGLHLGDALSLTDGLKAGWLDQDGGHFLAVFAEHLPYRMLLRVLAPDDHALGMHRLDSIGPFNLDQANNAVYLSNDDSNFLARASGGGLVLVTEVTAEHVEGVVFLLTLQNAAGLVTDAFPVSTFDIPG